MSIEHIVNGDYDFAKSYTHPTLGVGFEIDFTKMYNAPELTFTMMKELSEYYGTDQIDFDEYSQSGCETCDYGSCYGYKIQIFGATKNIPNLTTSNP